MELVFKCTLAATPGGRSQPIDLPQEYPKRFQLADRSHKARGLVTRRDKGRSGGHRSGRGKTLSTLSENGTLQFREGATSHRSRDRVRAASLAGCGASEAFQPAHRKTGEGIILSRRVARRTARSQLSHRFPLSPRSGRGRQCESCGRRHRPGSPRSAWSTAGPVDPPEPL